MRRISLPLLAACFCFLPGQVARAVTIDFNNGALMIVDNGIGDLNPAVDIVDFSTIVSGYSLQGTIDLGSGTNLTNLIGVPNGSVRLTNFVAEATAPNLGQLDIQFFHTVIGTYLGVIAADALDAFAAHATGAPVVAGNDSITNWQGFVSGQIITGVSPGPPPYPNPFVPAASPPVPYPVVTHGPMPITGALVDPVFGAYLSFDLRSTGDQLILLSSGEVGFSAIPEPGSWVLGALGVAGLAIVCRSRRRL